ncbi:MAG: hypothetical protein NZ842_14355 [Dehalococcoidia bacterium]|nr:hypothetical protein [Dehalococcoidia bacterium]
MKKKPLASLDRSGLKNYLFEIQDYVATQFTSGEDIDDFLDNTDIFDEFETVLPDEEYGIFVITILNKIRTNYIVERLLDMMEESQNRSNGHLSKT